MPVSKRRIAGLKVLIAGSVVAGSPEEATVGTELDEVYVANRVSRLPRRFLLQYLHSTRGLDTFLKTYLRICGFVVHSIGPMFIALRDNALPGHANWPEASRGRFQMAIAVPRNRYMHSAGQFPANDAEVQSLLSEMHDCIDIVSRL